MTQLVLTTLDWVPEGPRGYVRDMRVRWALEESGLDYRVETTSSKEKTPEHLAHQPFGQVPWLLDGDLSIFETGAILLHLGEKSDRLMPTDAKGRSLVIEWMFAALNSVETASLPWTVLQFQGLADETPAWSFLDGFMTRRRQRLEAVLTERQWLAGTFSAADILMADVLRIVDRLGGLEAYPACKDYVARATTRPAFLKAHADQIAHFKAADARMAAA